MKTPTLKALAVILGLALLGLPSGPGTLLAGEEASREAATSEVTESGRLAALDQAHVSIAENDPGDGANTLLVLNVRLVDREGEQEDTTVHLRVREGRLILVTQDAVQASAEDRAFDAEGGIVMGELVLGKPASFVVLDEDPRTNVAVLLDTAAHVRFAIVAGEVVRNDLAEIASEPQTERPGWLAYTPPPIALPVDYRNERKWNSFQTRAISGLFTGAVVLDRQRWLSQDATSEQQVGELSDFDGGEIRGLRFGLIGTLNFERPCIYTVFAATNGFDKGFDTDTDDDYSLFDFRLDIPLSRRTTLSIGKQNEPISMDRLSGGAFLPMQERAAVSDALLPSRNVGIVFSGLALRERFTWALGGFNDWIESSASFDESAKQVVGRFTGLPFVSADETSLLHLGVAIRYSDAREGLRYATEPEFNLSPTFVSTGDEVLEADESWTYGLEAAWRRGPFWVSGEHLRNEISAPELGNPVFSGTHVTASWVISRELRSYNRRSAVFGGIPVARSVYEGGWGSWEVGLRWSDIDLSDGEVEGGEMQMVSGALTWWLTRYFNTSLNVRTIELERDDLSSRSSGALVRLVLMLD